MTSIEEYLEANMVRIETSRGNDGNGRNLQGNNNNNYVPNFEGYLDLDFSIHVPCDGTTLLDCRLQIDAFSQSRLESLVMLFLCSEGIDLVISTAPDTLVHVCPFNSVSQEAPPMAKAANTALLNNLAQENAEPVPMIVWNLPRFESDTIAFAKTSTEEQKTFLDMATNTTFVLSTAPLQQYYNKLHFTYPVYQWGSHDPVLAEEMLQEEFETTVVSTGTLDNLLPWPDAIASPTGQEPYVFWNEPLPPPPAFFDNTIPANDSIALRWIGSGLMVFNTTVVFLLTALSAIKKRKDRKREEESETASHENQQRQLSDYLDTEAGVSAILMESKHYAMAKSQAFGASSSSQRRGSHSSQNSASVRSSARSSASGGGADRNITGVEVDLKVVVDHHPSDLLQRTRSEDLMQQQSAPSPLHYDHMRDPPTALGRKEDLLLARAKLETPWYSDRKLLGGNNHYRNDVLDDDDEDRARNEDLRLLDLISPRSEVSSTRVSRSSSRKNDPSSAGSC